MTFLLYAGQTIGLPEGVKADQMAGAIQNITNSGTASWLSVDLEGTQPKRVRVLFGPGIPVAIVSDQLDGHEVDLSTESLTAFLEGAAEI